MKMINVRKVLSKLDDVQPLSNYEWIARCPVHGDTERSLVVKSLSEHLVVIGECDNPEHQLTESTDGMEILQMGRIQCSHGCSVHSIVEALNFDFLELFPSHDECSVIRASFHCVFDESELFDSIKNLINEIPSTDQIAKFPKSGHQFEKEMSALFKLNQLSNFANLFLRNPLRSSEFPWDCRYGRFDWPYNDRLNSQKLEW
jgi:hypothetical protein